MPDTSAAAGDTGAGDAPSRPAGFHAGITWVVGVIRVTLTGAGRTGFAAGGFA